MKPLAALLEFSKQRANIEPRNYGDGRAGRSAYRSEARSVTEDLHRVKVVYTEALALGVTDEEILEASPRAFSGRLEWNTQRNEWDYRTGQYFPTEYRKAASSVLELAIALHKQAHASEVPRPSFATVADVVAYHQQTGSHWFDRSSMRFFGTRIHTKGILIAGRYFVTSEQPPHGPRGYTVREVSDDGDIRTIGELCGHASSHAASRVARLMVQP